MTGLEMLLHQALAQVRIFVTGSPGDGELAEMRAPSCPDELPALWEDLHAALVDRG